MNDNEVRKLLSTAFEPCNGGYLYYRNRWAGGVRVTDEEREQFISSDAATAFQLGREFAKRAQVTPPRHASPWLVADAIPSSFVVAVVIVAIAAAAEAERTNPPLPRFLLWGIGLFLGALALILLTRRLITNSSDR